jgi:hypothetical protein
LGRVRGGLNRENTIGIKGRIQEKRKMRKRMRRINLAVLPTIYF